MGRPVFPRSLAEFQARFASDEACRRYLMACRWPHGFRCPTCGDAGSYLLAARANLLQCRACRRQTSVTAGTVLDRTRLPLPLWFAAAYLVTTHTPGFSALQLQRQLGLARYETAWTMLQKLRRAMVRPVPLRWLTAGELRPALLRSDGEAEDLVDEGPLGRHVGRRHGTHLSLGQHRHGLDAGEGSPSGPEALKAEHRPCSALDPAVVLLDQVVEPLPAAVPGEAPQLALPLHLAQRAGVALEPVGDDGPRVAGVVPAEGPAEEALGRLLVALGAEQEVDGLAGAVDGAIQVAPLPVDPEVGLVDVPRPAAGPQVAARALLELGGEALDPAVHGRVVDLDPAVGEHALEVAVADRELQVPAHRPKDDLGREAEAAERPGIGHEQRSRIGGRWGSAAPTRLRAAAQRNGSEDAESILSSG